MATFYQKTLKVLAIMGIIGWTANAQNVGIGTTTPGSRLEVRGTTNDNTASMLNLTSNAGTSRFFVRNDGRVGINETSSLDRGMLTITSNLTNGINGWNRNIYFNNTNHSSITTDGLLLGFHDTNKAFYFGDITGTTFNKYVMTINATSGNVSIDAGNLRVQGLSGTGSRAVVADASGNLSAVPYSTVGDNLGNHTATTTLNMNGQSISSYAYLTPFGVGGNSGLSHASYSIYQEGGAWSNPFPDLNINFHTGIKMNAYFGYDGIRFYTGASPATGLAFQIGEASSDHIMGYRYLRLSSGNWFGVAGSAGIYNYEHGQHFFTTNNSNY